MKTRQRSLSAGDRFGRLTVIALSSPDPVSRNRRVECICDCGTKTIASLSNIVNGRTRSCGCGQIALTHGHSRAQRSPTYSSWAKMLSRCENANDDRWSDYGGRGISVCAEWHSFEMFLKDMGERPSSNHSIDRVDNSRGYAPDNCRWATPKQQQRNMRTNRLLTFKGRTQCLAAWADEVGMPYGRLSSRINRGWSIERALTERSA